MIAPLRKLDVECPPLFSDKSIIERMWRGSVKPGKTLPQYEDVVLGSLGRLGDHLLLFQGATPEEFKVLRASSARRGRPAKSARSSPPIGRNNPPSRSLSA